MADHPGALVSWIVDGKDEGIGYFQKWSLPVPGDQVELDRGKGKEAEIVTVTHRRFTQPETEPPRITIYAKRPEPEPAGPGGHE